ncbi:hypothetical protein CK203_110521 [Vitis vinifera]|uniref:NB-ARC domain-containing protein n=1 Tax=Vitis vinifera TaxID=29760 RepID=A0A438D606_VITVI|nr:hypothetical protein CK203_110521 [Vitis vinifera]
MVGAIGALEQASRNLDEAPKRVRSLEDFVCDLENLTQRIKQKHAYKLHNPQLEYQIQSLNSLIERLHPNIRKARRIVSKSRAKNLAKVVWTSVAGDPLEKLVNSIRDDLNWWLESQRLAGSVEKVIESTARTISKQDSSHRVILIVGLSGIGKSCLARQVAADPPMKFVDGAVELGFGQWCSRAACNESKDKYQRRLARKICKFLVQIGFWKKIRDENSGDLEYMCCLLQEALYGKSILILLDDVWEQDIVERFAKLYDNNCSYLVTTRNEAVYEITEAQKVELNKDDIKEISKAILLYHSHLSEEEVPGVAESLLERCGHHPLTVAVMGPVSYVNEKEAENTLTIFRSFEFSLEAMPEDSRRLFIALAALSWAEPVPEACLESVLVHDMVSLYLDCRTHDSRTEFCLSGLEEKQAAITLEAIIQALMASESISELEASRASFSSILGPRIENLISSDSQDLIAVTAEAVTIIFSKSDYQKYFPSLETTGAVEKLASILENCEDLMIQTNISIVLAKLAEFGSLDTVDKVLQSILINQLADLLSPNNEEWHEIAQHHAIVTLKAFYEVGGPPANGSLQPGNLNLLPWQARLSLERFVLSDISIPLAPKPQTFEYLIHKLLDHDIKQVLEAMQDLIPIVEKAGDSRIRKMILQSPLIKRLSELLQYGHSEQNTIRSESAFLLTKLACSELQDSSYTALHQMLFGNGGVLIINRMLQMGLIERLAHSLEGKSMKTREVNMHCILDIVELGSKACLERMLSLQVGGEACED